MDTGLAAFIAGLLGFWTVAYTLGRGRKGRLEVYPGALLIRAGIRLDPMPPGRARSATLAFGYLSALLLAVSAGLFYYYVGYVFTLKYIVRPEEPVAGFSPLIPGVTIGWVDTVYIMLAVGVAAFFHELSHALVSRAVGVRVKDAGVALFLFIPAAFVEPDEDEMKKARLRDRILIYSAGVGSNVILALVFLALLAQATQALALGVKIAEVAPGSPADQAGLEPGMIIVEVNGEPVKTIDDLVSAFERAGVGDKNRSARVELKVITPDGGEKLLVVEKPAGKEKIGIIIAPAYEKSWLVTFLRAGYIINFSLALINAAPLAIPLPGGVLFTDGGHIVRDIAASRLGEEKGNAIALAVGLGTLIIVLSLMSLTRLTIS